MSDPTFSPGIVSKPPLGERDRAALSDFAARVRAELGDQLIEMRLFGSKARGDPMPDSDIDILVVVDDSRPRWISANAVSDIAFDVNLDHDVLISTIVMTAAAVADERRAESPLMRAIRDESTLL